MRYEYKDIAFSSPFLSSCACVYVCVTLRCTMYFFFRLRQLILHAIDRSKSSNLQYAVAAVNDLQSIYDAHLIHAHALIYIYNMIPIYIHVKFRQNIYYAALRAKKKPLSGSAEVDTY